MTESLLFQPLRIAGLRLKNRLVLPAMSSGLARLDGVLVTIVAGRATLLWP